MIECSSGSFAVALAVACAHSRHPLMLCMPATVPLERQQMLTKFGAQIVLSTMFTAAGAWSSARRRPWSRRAAIS